LSSSDPKFADYIQAELRNAGRELDGVVRVGSMAGSYVNGQAIAVTIGRKYDAGHLPGRAGPGHGHWSPGRPAPRILC